LILEKNASVNDPNRGEEGTPTTNSTVTLGGSAGASGGSGSSSTSGGKGDCKFTHLRTFYTHRDTFGAFKITVDTIDKHPGVYWLSVGRTQSKLGKLQGEQRIYCKSNFIQIIRDALCAAAQLNHLGDLKGLADFAVEEKIGNCHIKVWPTVKQVPTSCGLAWQEFITILVSKTYQPEKGFQDKFEAIDITFNELDNLLEHLALAGVFVRDEQRKHGLPIH
jgi:hypothetical protein